MASRGRIVIDECAIHILADGARKAEWQTIRISPSDYGMKDPEFLAKYPKGRSAVLTSDKGMYRHNPETGGATSFVIHEDVSKEDLDDYKLKFDDFWAANTHKTLKGKRIIVPVDGDIVYEDLESLS